jgi:LmbE family N-acetylglucosaminyl deacetylase
MSFLIASDKLFLSLSLGGALIALVVYTFASGWNLASQTVHWVVSSLLAGVGALGVIAAVNSRHITNIINEANLSPYGLVHSLHDLGLGLIYGALGLLTNFGANPAFNTTVLKQVPSQAIHHIFGISGLAFIVNAIILICGLYLIGNLLVYSLEHNHNRQASLNRPDRLALFLSWTSIAALVVFIASKHYYAADARYLTVTLFAVFITGASFMSRKNWPVKAVILVGGLLVLSTALGAVTTVRAYHEDKAALSDINGRNEVIAQAIRSHKIDVLVGDYWRVIPTKRLSDGKQNVLPLAGCTEPRDILSSQDWQPDLNNHSFAYILSLDKSLTDFPSCSLDQVVAKYGRPNASIVIAGNLSQPKEQLLFYDRGANKSSPVIPGPQAAPSTVIPTALDDIPHSVCHAPTIMVVVAHEDDDLLFMNPDLSHEIQAGHCVRTVYVTAGDAGHDKFYWLGREQGSQAAYDFMDGPGSDIWVQRIVKLSDKQYIIIANPRGNTKISLVFMHLPDGNMKGQGFKSSHYENLDKLDKGIISSIQSVDGESSYTAAEFQAALTQLMQFYNPAEIKTQSTYIGSQFIDHSDHNAVGRLTEKAYRQYINEQYGGAPSIPLRFYRGYTGHELSANIGGDELAQKLKTFILYGQHDGSVCHTEAQCVNDPAYGAYVTRQYAEN